MNELRSIVDSLRAERERRGMSREEVASRAGLDVRSLEDLEEHRDLNPQLSTLTRFAAAVGRHLMLGLAAGQAPLPKLPIESVQSSTSIETPTA
jgi:transcriptional regulator with XRE-family HTH domain